MSPPAIIELRDLVKIFPSAPVGSPPALGGVTASIPAGKIVGLVGPDAAGKTTLLRLLAGLLLPTSGSIHWGTKDMGYMPQRFGLYEDLSVQDNLDLHAELRGLEGPAREGMFAKLLTFTALTPFVSRLAGQLSGGMKQKLGLACALLTTPRLLLLDEPGVGVDPLSRRELWAMVEQLTGDGMSVLWSTAYLEEAQRCAHVLMLDQGLLVYAGEPQPFMDRVAGRVFQVQIPAGGLGQALALASRQPGVRDALIQGSRLRLVLGAEVDAAGRQHLGDLLLGHADYADPAAKVAALEPLQACLEDAYMDCVGGINQTPSPFGPVGTAVGTTYDTSGSATVGALGSPAYGTTYGTLGSPLGKGADIIRAEGLTRHFGDFVAARDITFRVRAGQIFGLLGPNGAGKSTTFRMLCGLLRPTQGQCWVAGKNLLSAQEEARAQLGYMAQKFSLYGELTVRQNLQLMADLYGIPRALQGARIAQRIEALDLGPFVRRKSGELPLGYKQRLAMACATLHNPPVLFLDEPTSGVDPRTRREFWKHISAMTQAGVAVLVTTHFMEEAEYCDEIALIIHGMMIAQGSPDGLKSHCPKEFLDAPPAGQEGGLPTLEDAFIAYIRADNATLAAQTRAGGH